jgi:hypothetical protein
MKKLCFKNAALIMGLLFVSVSNVVGQKISGILSDHDSPVFWLGVDFTQAQIMGAMGTVDQNELLGLFDKINLLIVTERDKYNIKDALRKKEVPYDLTTVNKQNYQIAPEKIIVTASNLNSGRINQELIASLVSNYKMEEKNGTGMVIFMESLDKTSERGIMWVTFFNIASGELIFTEKMTGTASGIGFRNHWASTVFEVITQIKNSKFKEWKSAH